MARTTTTTAQLLHSFKQYLVTWLNIIASERGLYPPTSFETRNSFNVRVPYSRHPTVIQWQMTLIDDLLSELTLKHLMAVRVVLSTDERMECFTVDVREMWTIPADFHDRPIDMSLEEVVDQYRANLMALMSDIRALPPMVEPHLEVMVETKGVSMNEDWVLDKTEGEGLNNIKALPVVDCGPIVFYSSLASHTYLDSSSNRSTA